MTSTNRHLFQQLSQAHALLRRGIPVGVPTETVYGLAAPIDSPSGIERIFLLKERPFFDPLIVHLSGVDEVLSVVRVFPDVARVLAEEFWPGPLTIVLPRRPDLNSMICAGLDTVGVRVPAHPVCRRLIRRLGVPLAAPSANKFGKTSPTTAEHVRANWPGDEVFVVDGGPCQVGLESTVISISEDSRKEPPRILRRGMVTATDIENCLQANQFDRSVSYGHSSASPGHLDQHYQPAIPLVVVSAGRLPLREEDFLVLERNLGISGRKYSVLELGEEPTLAARNLYTQLYQFGKSGSSLIVVERLESHGGEYWESIWDRIYRAATLVTE